MLHTVLLLSGTGISAAFIPIALILGAILSFLIPMSYLKGQLKSVRAKDTAADYVRPGSMEVTTRRDIYLYRNVTRVAKPKDNSKK